MMSGRGWFPLSVRELQGGFDFTALRPPNMDASVESVRDLIFHLEPESLVLGGFSQGAMIATEVAMLDADVVKGLVLYSGTLLDEVGWRKNASTLKDMPILMSHGVRDPVLPVAYAQRLFEILKAAGAKVQMTEFPGGHEIPPPVLSKTKSFIKSILDE
jgi:phospholipase/carboxylesterase